MQQFKHLIRNNSFLSLFAYQIPYRDILVHTDILFLFPAEYPPIQSFISNKIDIIRPNPRINAMQLTSRGKRSPPIYSTSFSVHPLPDLKTYRAKKIWIKGRRIRSCGFLRIFTYTDDELFQVGLGYLRGNDFSAGLEHPEEALEKGEKLL